MHIFFQYFFLFFILLWPSSCDWRKTIQCNIVLKIFNSLWQILNLLKIVKTIFQHIIVLQSWKNCHRMYTIWWYQDLIMQLLNWAFENVQNVGFEFFTTTFSYFFLFSRSKFFLVLSLFEYFVQISLESCHYYFLLLL